MTHVNGWKLAVVAIAVALAGTAQAQSQGTTGSSGQSGSSASGSTAPSTSGSSSGMSSGSSASAQGTQGKKVDKGFQDRIEKIHAANQAEIEMGKLAAQQAQSPEVKQFGETLEKDHTKADQKLTEAAQTAGIQLEGKEFQKKHDDAMKDMKKMQGKTGTDFDKDFVNRMAKEHDKDIKEVKKAAEEARKNNQTELASTLEAMTSGLQKHLDVAKKLKDTVGKAGKAQGRRPAQGGQMGSGGQGSLGTGSSSGSSSSGSMGSQGSSSGTSGATTPSSPSDTSSKPSQPETQQGK